MPAKRTTIGFYTKDSPRRIFHHYNNTRDQNLQDMTVRRSYDSKIQPTDTELIYDTDSGGLYVKNHGHTEKLSDIEVLPSSEDLPDEGVPLKLYILIKESAFLIWQEEEQGYVLFSARENVLEYASPENLPETGEPRVIYLMDDGRGYRWDQDLKQFKLIFDAADVIWLMKNKANKTEIQDLKETTYTKDEADKIFRDIYSNLTWIREEGKDETLFLDFISGTSKDSVHKLWEEDDGS